jgi:tetratricopeptide (TPR) repeat protein
VFPFSVRGGPDVQYLGEGIVNLLATSLDGAGELRSVDPRAVLATAERQGSNTIGPERGARIADELKAGFFILGDIVQVGEQIRIDAGLYDRRDGTARVAKASVDGDPADVLVMVDEIAAQLLASGVAGAGSRVTRIAAVTTSSLTALKSYLEGENEFRAGRFTSAVEAFQNAVAADSQFALAFYRLSIAAEWALRPDLAREAAEGAVRHGNRLSDHDRRLLEALLAHRRGDFEDAERMFSAIVAVWPQDVEAWVQLGEVRFHYYPLVARDFTESAEAFARVLSFEPDHVTSLLHMHRIAAQSGDRQTVDSLGRRIRQLNPEGDRALGALAFSAVLSGDTTGLASMLAEMASAPDISLPQALFDPSIWTDSLVRTARLMEMETATGRSAEVRALGHVHLAYLEAMQGRWSSARQQLARAEVLNRVLGLEHRAFLALVPLMPVSDTELGEVRDALLALDPETIPPSRFPSAHFTIHDNLHAVLKPYLLGHLHVRLGDVQAAVTAARSVRTAAVDSAMVELREALAGGIEEAVAEARGDDASALREIDLLEGIGNYEPAMFSPFLSLAAERYRRAARLEGLGHLADAARGYASFENFNFYDRVFAAPGALRLARIAEREGRLADARQHYERFLFWWSDPDDDLRALVDEARSALARIEAGG